jgi:hypothetical protein
MENPNGKPAREPRLLTRNARHRLVDVSCKPSPIAVADVMMTFGGRPLGINSGDDKAPIALLTIRDGLMHLLDTRSNENSPNDQVTSGCHVRERRIKPSPGAL